MNEQWQTQSLLEEISAPPNLTQAWRKVRSNVARRRRAASCGVDDISVATFEQQWESNLTDLHHSLLDGTYRPLPPKRVELGKPNGGKRVIGVLAVRDRVAQRAAQQVLEPIFEPHFLDCSYGFRPGRSTEDAVHQLLCYRQAGCRWVLDADVAACFDSLDHKLLLRFVERRVKEPAVLDLIQSWLEAGVLRVDEEVRQRDTRLNRLTEQAWVWIRHQITPGRALPMQEDIYLGEESWDADWERQQTWKRIGSDMLLLALTGVRPTLRRVRPLARWLARRKRAVLGSTGVLGLATLGGVWYALRRWEPQGRGALQGGALSPLLANVYLHHFDRPMIDAGHRLVRYADDFVICCESRAEAEARMGDVARTLSDLRLRLNVDKTQVISFDHGFRFLGYRIRGHKVTPPLKYRRTSS